MNKENEILEYVETHAKVEYWEHEGTKKKQQTWIFLNYLPGKRKKFYHQIYAHFLKPEELNIFFKNIVVDILTWEDWDKPLKKVKTIWKVCPEMICGDNPCSCEE